MKKFILISLFLTCSLSIIKAQKLVYTEAGTGKTGFFGDGGKAVSAELNNPSAVAVDKAGNIYIADTYNNRIRKIVDTGGGFIYTIAGNGKAGYSGDGGAATLAELHFPSGVAVDDSGNVYIADDANNVVRKVNSAGIISTFAGTGLKGYSGDGGLADTAKLNSPFGVAVDTSWNVYIADNSNHCIRKVSAAGIISTIAGNGTGGYVGDGGLANAAELYYPTGVAIDSVGNVYIADNGNNVIRKVNTAGIISTIAGNYKMGYSGDSGKADTARLSSPKGVAVDGQGNVYIGDWGNNRVREVNTAGYIYTVAGDSSLGYNGDGKPADSTTFWAPLGVALDIPRGNIYIADQKNNRIRKLTGVILEINELSPYSSKVNVYPVPGNGVFNFRISNYELGIKSTLVIYNALGEKIYSKILNPNSQSLIDISGQPAGIYLYRIISEKGLFIGSGKLVIQK